jgi:hypothetical protein
MSSAPEASMATTKIPLGLLGIPFGLAGLSEAWLALASGQHAPVVVGRVILLISAASWLASQAGDRETTAEAQRHLGIAAHRAGNLDEARRRLEAATLLRRQTGQLTSAAANMVGLAYIAVAQERADDARALLDEADAIATASGARRIRQQVDEARSRSIGR